jgi:hypothetical protein
VGEEALLHCAQKRRRPADVRGVQAVARSATTGAAQVPQKQTEMEVKVAMLETTKKGRAILQVFSCIFCWKISL